MENTTTETGGSTVNAPKVYNAVPAGEYQVELEAFEDRKTRSGRAVVGTFKVTSGEHEGRKFWHYFNYINNSDFAQKIGREQLDKVLVALGGEGFEALNGNTGLIGDFVQNGTLVAKVAIKPEESYIDKNGQPAMSKEGNKITSFKAL